jgi:hypothetical protein
MLWIAALAAAIPAGCSWRSEELSSPTALRLKALAAVYLDFAVARGRGPANEHELKKHAQHVPAFALPNGCPIPDVAESWRSERDGEPLVVLYSLSISRITTNDPPIVAFETLGENGKCLAVDACGKVESMEKAQIQEMVPSENQVSVRTPTSRH